MDWVLTTHVHLDHAGGAGALMQALPNARCAVHPRGARHLAEPSKLIAGSIAVYGEERFRELYGEIVPIDEARMLVPEDGERIRLGSRSLELIHTPGHALHHYCVVDREHDRIFSGDTFGLSYRDFDVDGREFILPTTTPVHFDPEALCHSVDRLMAYRPEADLPDALFGGPRPRAAGAGDEGARARLRRPRPAPRAMRRTAADKLRNGMCAMMSALARRARLSARTTAKRHRLLDDDIELNCQGIEVWLDGEMNKFRAFRINERDRRIVAGFETMSVDAADAGRRRHPRALLEHQLQGRARGDRRREGSCASIR